MTTSGQIITAVIAVLAAAAISFVLTPLVKALAPKFGFVDIPKDVTANRAEYNAQRIEPVLRVTETIREEDLEEAVALIQKAKKPYIFVGGGAVISDCSDELREFVDKVDAPVCDTLMGKGAFNGTDERYTGMLGMHGTKTSNLGVSECDLLIAVGVRFSDRVLGNAKKFAKDAKILQFDVDAAEMNKNILITEGVVGDLKVVLQKMNERLEQQNHKEWIEKIISYKEKYPMTYHPDVLSGPFIVEEIYRQTNGEAGS